MDITEQCVVTGDSAVCGVDICQLCLCLVCLCTNPHRQHADVTIFTEQCIGWWLLQIRSVIFLLHSYLGYCFLDVT